MNLPVELLRGVYGYGFEKPSIVQQRAIVPLGKGLDMIAQVYNRAPKQERVLIIMRTVPKWNW